MSVREYIGARYVMKFADPIQHDSTKTYEPLTVVQDIGVSYVSKQYVPTGIAINNTDYWIEMAQYNAQIEQYRQEVIAYDGRITANTNAIDAVEALLPDTDFTSTNTVKDAIDAVSDVIPASSFTSSSTVKDAIDSVANDLSTLDDNLAAIIPDGAFDAEHTIKDAIDAVATDVETLENSIPATIDNRLNQLRHYGGITTGTLQAIYECACTYMRDNIVYRHRKSGEPDRLEADNAWNYTDGPEVVMVDGVPKYAINCSALINLVMSGVPYDSSAYNLGTGHNIFGKAGYCFSMYDEAVDSSNWELYDRTRYMAQRLLELGLAEYITENYTNVVPGDVIFFTNDINDWEETYHCALVLGGPYCMYDDTDNSKAMFITLEASESEPCVKVRGRTGYSLNDAGAFLTAHIPYGYVPEHETRLFTDVIDTTTGFEVSCNGLPSGYKVITCDFDSKVTGLDPSLTFAVNGYSASYGGKSIDAVITPQFSGQLDKWEHHRILVHLSSATNGYADTNRIRVSNMTDCEFKNFKIYDGIGCIENNALEVVTAESLSDIQDAILENFGTTGNYRAYQEMHFTLPIQTSADDEITIGTYEMGSFIYTFECTGTVSSTLTRIYAKFKHGLNETVGYYNGSTWAWT